MKALLFTFFLIVFLMISPIQGTAHGGDIADFLKTFSLDSILAPGEDGGSIASGLKEALSVGTGNAVKLLSARNGYFGNEAVKILLPENFRKIGNALAIAGYQKEVDSFILSMNRAAERAAPQAADIFAGAIRAMSIEDAQKILKGGNTAATEYFKAKTSPRLFDAFKPEVSRSMNEAGVTKAYKSLIERYTSIVPFVKLDSLDLDRYVTENALHGLFYMIGKEEAEIRTNPAARTTELLKKVFGNKT
jgi:hypothetical protein